MVQTNENRAFQQHWKSFVTGIIWQETFYKYEDVKVKRLWKREMSWNWSCNFLFYVLRNVVFRSFRSLNFWIGQIKCPKLSGLLEREHSNCCYYDNLILVVAGRPGSGQKWISCRVNTAINGVSSAELRFRSARLDRNRRRTRRSLQHFVRLP